MSISATSDTTAATPAPAPKKAAPRKASTKKAATKKVTTSKPKTASKTASKTATTRKTTSRKATAPAKPAKVKKPKLVRDSYTLPKDEYAALTALKQRSIQLARPAKKSELLRAGIRALSTLSDKALLAALQAVPSIKTGRPKKD
ncbi:MAG: hypothetical protein O9318_03725 [Hylemonella sp.]|uniref:hypothetical protein n=1 Tax=Hylemonella sp. TaxID=2066020 RepID=UPI0022CB2850|nr:hypothetical protein [Hylemonella sp.]MCZ8251560.1 hypothetical protein [Hylemonella sp.]